MSHKLYDRAAAALVYVLVSVFVLIPCFWLPRIEAGDLASHSYNAWLASLVSQGKAPGLWIASQHNNILFDVMLSRWASLAGFVAGEKIAVAIAVLVFVWGSFALVSAVGEKRAWFLLPVLVTLAYGWTFHMGFFNFYLSLGLSFWALAVLWCARKWIDYLYLIPLAALIWLAHPLGLVWFTAVGLYIVVARALAPRGRFYLAIFAVYCVLPIRFYLERKYAVNWTPSPVYDLLGANQLVLGGRYFYVGLLLCAVIVCCAALQLWQMRGDKLRVADYFPLPAQLYLVAVLALLNLPDAILLPQYAEPVLFIRSRFTLAIGILGCCALTRLRWRVPFAALSACIALAYFFLIHQDARRTYAMEMQAEALVSQVPPGSRILTTIQPFPDFHILVHQVVDRACIGRCFNIDNYEAATRQFRLRAVPGNRIVAADPQDTNQMLMGTYRVRPEDLPLWHIYQCEPNTAELCLRPLHPGSLTTADTGEIETASRTATARTPAP